MRFAILLCLSALLCGCATQAAPCSGALRPINQPAAVTDESQGAEPAGAQP
jgi:hypothetical protein